MGVFEGDAETGPAVAIPVPESINNATTAAPMPRHPVRLFTRPP
jgi:hypothetical protein